MIHSGIYFKIKKKLGKDTYKCCVTLNTSDEKAQQKIVTKNWDDNSKNSKAKWPKTWPTNLQNYPRNKENYAEKSNRILIAKTEKTEKNVETKQRTNAVKHTMWHEIFACFNFCHFFQRIGTCSRQKKYRKHFSKSWVTCAPGVAPGRFLSMLIAGVLWSVKLWICHNLVVG